MSRIASVLAALLLVSGCVQSSTGGPGGGSLSGPTVDRSAMSRRVVDGCIYRQYRAPGVDRATMVEDCRCASRRAMKSLGDAPTFAVPRSGGLTGAQDRAMREGIAACFKA